MENKRSKGYKHTEEWKIQNSVRHKGNTYGRALKGKKLTEEHKKKLSEAAIKRVLEGRHNNYRGGQPNCLDCGIKLVSYIAKRCRKCRTKHDLSGEKHWAWKGGISPINKRIRSSNRYLIWRKKILDRDGYTCTICGDRNYKGRGKTVAMQVDHIKPFYLFPKLRFKLSNGRTLCVDCHSKTPTWGRPKKIQTLTKK